MNVVPVDDSNVEEAIKFLNWIFPDDVKRYNNPEIAMRCSLTPQDYEEYYNNFGLIKTTPYLLLKDNKIIGTTGLYYLKKDPPGTAWLGWFCIAPGERGKGLGSGLLEWTMDKARKEGNTRMKVYTSDDPDLATSQILYDKYGFKTVGEGEGEGEKLIYKEVSL